MNTYTERENFLVLSNVSKVSTEKKTKKKEREREDVFDVLPERGREARVHAQGAPRLLLLPRVSFFLSFVVGGDVWRCLLDPKKILLAFFFGLEFFDIIISLDDFLPSL